MHKPHPKNVPGPFYVEDGCCLSCAVWENDAPEHFGWDDSHCYVSRQPKNREEIGLMISVMDLSEVDCLRYRGFDEEVRRQIAAAGFKDRCD